MSEIKKVAVIGSGVMGSAIAAHIANSGTEVLLLDIVPEGADNCNELAQKSIERMLKTEPAPFTHKSKAKLVTAANLEDDLDRLGEVDWIIEAVLERIDIKHDVYKKIDAVRKEGSVVSSNTSTIPLHQLIEGMPDGFCQDFMITHFFNPPRYMRLFELVGGDETRRDALEMIRQFADVRLGKGVVECKDTPGFLANRIGCFWMTAGVLEAVNHSVTVEEADAVMSRPIGVPKTGVFGLLDLIGIDLMPLIAKAFSGTLPENDAFLKIYQEPEWLTQMIADGYTGRKGKGGFYRLNKDDGKKVKEAKNLQTGDYAPAEKPQLESVNAAKSGLSALLEHDDRGGKYARAVMLQTLSYAASLIPDISDDIVSVDKAMRWGYNWKYGPFELIDRLGNKEVSGPQWLANALEAEGMDVPELLKKAGNNPLYKKDDEGILYLDLEGNYQRIVVPSDVWMLADKKYGKKPVKSNASCKVWDIGDGVLCLEYTSKMNSVDPEILGMMQELVSFIPENGYKGLVIGNDADNFCVGANLGFLLFAANIAGWKMIDGVIKQGQDAYMGLKYAPFPVVTAVSGMALGGGCEILLHSDAVQAHVETYTGLVEVGVGVIPGWGGCKEMLLRHKAKRDKELTATARLGRMFSAISVVRSANTMPAVTRSFEQIALAKVAKSAEEAKDMLILRDSDAITMNRNRLLPDAKAKVLALASGYQLPEKQTMQLPGKSAKTALTMGINGFVKSGKATAHDEVVSKALAEVLSGDDTDIGNELTEQELLDLERKIFNRLIRTQGTLDRVEHMLETGKPLRN